MKVKEYIEYLKTLPQEEQMIHVSWDRRSVEEAINNMDSPVGPVTFSQVNKIMQEMLDEIDSCKKDFMELDESFNEIVYRVLNK